MRIACFAAALWLSLPTAAQGQIIGLPELPTFSAFVELREAPEFVPATPLEARDMVSPNPLPPELQGVRWKLPDRLPPELQGIRWTAVAGLRAAPEKEAPAAAALVRAADGKPLDASTKPERRDAVEVEKRPAIRIERSKRIRLPEDEFGWAVRGRR